MCRILYGVGSTDSGNYVGPQAGDKIQLNCVRQGSVSRLAPSRFRPLDRVRRREFDRVIIAKRGVAVAMLTPPPVAMAEVEKLYGFLPGSVVIPPGIDLTAPVADESFAAGGDKVHR
jgi:hypothetical protein